MIDIWKYYHQERDIIVYNINIIVVLLVIKLNIKSTPRYTLIFISENVVLRIEILVLFISVFPYYIRCIVVLFARGAGRVQLVQKYHYRSCPIDTVLKKTVK